MRKLLYKNTINWEEVSAYVSRDDVIVGIPDGFLGFKKTDNFKEKLEYLIGAFDNLSSIHWIKFFYNAEFDEKDIVNLEQEVHGFSKDIVLLSAQGKELDALNFLEKEFTDSKDNVDFNSIFSDSHYKLDSFPDYRVRPVSEIGISAENYLSRHTLGRYHLDPAAAPFTGVAFEYKTPSYNQFNYGYGRAFDFKTAKSIASLEGVERFASEFYAFDYKDEVKEGSYNEVTKSYSVLPFEELTLEENSKLDTDTNLYWIPGTSIRDGQTLLVPEDLVYYGNHPSRPGYIRKMHDSSNGVALGSNYSEAMISSLLELIERHSFLMTWYGKVPGRKLLDYEFLLGEKETNILNKVEATGAEIQLFEISTFKDVYVVWGLVKNNSKDSTVATYTSAGAGFTVEEAARAALMEVAVGYLVQKNYHAEYPELPEKVETLDDHIEYYANPDNWNEFDFTEKFEEFDYDKAGKSVFENVNYQEDILRHLINETLADYERIIFVNQTSKEMKNAGLFVVKSIIPDFLPMTFGEGNLRISVENINKSRKLLGLDEIQSFMPIPHPFP